MAVFAGLIRTNNGRISKEEFEEFRNSFENACGLKVSTHFKDASALLLSAGIDSLYGQPEATGNDTITIIAGEPLFSPAQNPRKNVDADIINGALTNNRLKARLKTARGIFSGISINKNTNEIHIYVDKMGIRPVYYYKYGDSFVFSSLLLFLKSLDKINLTLDSKGMIEYLGFDFCIANRTPYLYIKRIDAGEIITVQRSRSSFQRSKYWDWESISVKDSLEEPDIRALYDKFVDAVEIRLGKNDDASAFLSGGLDSRSIVTILKTKIDDIRTYNFATCRSQDSEYARRFAQRSHLNHLGRVLPSLSYPNWSQLISSELNQDAYQSADRFQKRFVWSGDGGSVAVGGVYLDQKSLDLFSSRSFDSAISNWLSFMKITAPSRFLRPSIKNAADQDLKYSISEELGFYKGPSSQFPYHFLMNNDQKRHLDNHFETICDHRIELLLPFFDSELVEKLYSIPAQEFLYHDLYMRFFELFPAEARETPWQTYPGHIPCSVPDETNLEYQWDPKNETNMSLKDDFKLFMSLNHELVFNYFDKKKVIAALSLHHLGIRNYRYLIEKIASFSSLG